MQKKQNKYFIFVLSSIFILGFIFSALSLGAHFLFAQSSLTILSPSASQKVNGMYGFKVQVSGIFSSGWLNLINPTDHTLYTSSKAFILSNDIFRVDWDTKVFPDGDYCLSAMVVDKNNTMSRSLWQHVIVDNKGYQSKEVLSCANITIESDSVTQDTSSPNTTDTDPGSIDPSSGQTYIISILSPQAGSVIAGTQGLKATSNNALDSLLFSLDNPDTPTVPDYLFNAQDAGGRTSWIYSLDSKQIKDSTYYLYSVGKVGQQHYISQGTYSVSIKNASVNQDTILTPLLNENTVPEIKFTLLEPALTDISGEVALKAQVSSNVGSLIYILNGPSQINITGNLSENVWYAKWNTLNFPNGTYQLMLVAKAAGAEYKSQQYNLNVKNSIASTRVLIIFPDDNTTIQQNIVLRAGVENGTATQLQFKIFQEENPIKVLNAGYQSSLGVWTQELIIGNYSNGTYKIVAEATIAGTIYQSSIRYIHVLHPSFNETKDIFLAFKSPIRGQILSDKIFLIVQTTGGMADEVDIKLTFENSTYTLGKARYDAASQTWIHFWDTMQTKNGEYALGARARLSTKYYNSDPIYVIVKNVTPSTETQIKKPPPEPGQVAHQPKEEESNIPTIEEPKIEKDKQPLPKEPVEPVSVVEKGQEEQEVAKTGEENITQEPTQGEKEAGEVFETVGPKHSLHFLQPRQKDVFGNTVLEVQASVKVDSLEIIISREKNQETYDARYDAAKGSWKTFWDTRRVSNGIYRIVAFATLRGQTIKSLPKVVWVKNTRSEPINTLEEKEFDTSKKEALQGDLKNKLWIIKPFHDAEIFGNINLMVGADQGIVSVEMIYFKDGIKNIFAQLDKLDQYRWHTVYDTTLLENGNYILQAKGASQDGSEWYSNQVGVMIQRMIQDKPQAVQVVDEYFLPDECQKLAITSSEECKLKLKELSLLSFECKEAGIYEIDRCEIYMKEKFFPAECVQKGLATMKDCQALMRQQWYKAQESILYEVPRATILPPPSEVVVGMSNLPKACMDSQITKPEDCQKFLYEIDTPDLCKKAKVTDSKACNQLLFANFSPPECKKAGLTTKAECDALLFQKNIPQVCVDKNILEKVLCDNYILEKNLPQECRTAGALSAGACKKFMFEKLKQDNEQFMEELPYECGIANITTKDHCAKYLEEKYLPLQCVQAGIKSGTECQNYLQELLLPSECRNEGIKSQQECNAYLKKIYIEPECTEAGISDNTKCKEYIAQKYSSDVQCEGLERMLCESVLQERHISMLVFEQKKKEAVNRVVDPDIGKTIVLEKLEKTEIPKNIKEISRLEHIVPIKVEEKTPVLILPSEDRIVLSKDENILKASAAVITHDFDSDGVPDDIERRLGTDATIADSDFDGFDDGYEIKNNFNPLGSGAMKQKLAPVEEAIIQKKNLQQPKVAGAISEDLKIEKIEDIVLNKNIRQKISGKALPGSVVLLYIYSELPMITQAQTDEFGNWTYTLQNSLLDGNHEIYVTINDNTGKIVSKSNPISFMVREARAVSASDLFGSPVSQAKPKTLLDRSKNYLWYAVGLILFGLILFMFFMFQGKKKRQ